jgi:hypothetical protein
MKLNSLLIAGLLLGTAVGAWPSVSKADGVQDPKIIINVFDPVIDCDTVTCFQGDVISGVFTGTDASTLFAYASSDPSVTLPPLFTLEYDLADVPLAAPIQCYSNALVDCTQHFDLSTLAGSGTNLTATLVTTFDDIEALNYNPVTGFGSGSCDNPITQGDVCSGEILQNDLVQVIVRTPEPSSALLLLVGLIPIVGLVRRRRKISDLA